MKSWGKTLGLLTIGVMVISHVTRAQLGSISPIALLPDAADGQVSVPDSIVRIAAEAEGLSQVDPASLPFFASCWWTVSPGGAPVPMPCPPQDLSVPIYQIVDGIYLVDETGGAVSVSVPRTSPMRAVTTASITSAVESQGSAIASLIEQVQATAAAQQNRLLARAMGINVPMPGEGGGTNSYYLGGSGFTIPDYGTNLWIAQTAVAAGSLTGIGTNTIAEVQYEIQSRTNLAQADWQSEGFIYGSPATNWTPLSVPQTGRTNLFIRLRSWATDASSLPIWWQLQYFGTNGVDPYGNPQADGWNNYQKFALGWDPGQFYTPAAPQGVKVIFNQPSRTATITWLASAGGVTGYTVRDSDGDTFNVSATTTTMTDDVSNDQPDLASGNIQTTYAVQGHYAKGDSAWSPAIALQPATVSGTLIPDPSGGTFLEVSGIPANAVSIRFTVAFRYFLFQNGDYITCNSNIVHDIPMGAFTNGRCQIPSTWQTLPVGGAYYESIVYMTICSVDSTGTASAAEPVYGNWGVPFVLGTS